MAGPGEGDNEYCCDLCCDLSRFVVCSPGEVGEGNEEYCGVLCCDLS